MENMKNKLMYSKILINRTTNRSAETDLNSGVMSLVRCVILSKTKIPACARVVLIIR